VKIGYAVALRLLRAGADVIITSRFPHDAAKRYIQEPDFAAWRERLHIYGLDLRDIPRAEAFVTHLYETYPYLDAIINNAAQTVKRPPAYYAHLIPFETAPTAELPAEVRVLLKGNSVLPTAGSLVSGLEDVFPIGQLDEHGQQIDNRDFTSWVMRLEDVPISELVEVHLVNAIAPAVFAGQLKELLASSPHSPRFIVNVSAAEGRFAQFKTGFHPHTNMAKAALNMLTRTIADEYAEQGICVVSVDPGWVSDQIPHTSDISRQLGAARLPIDLVDAASRICDPLFSAVQGETVAVGRLFKDYDVVDW
jgi:NAD(P)-dependent dehydrogenase (short-subunit alcohol dehydrogenase family)